MIDSVWDQKRALVDLLLKMGCGSTALDLLISLKMYEDAAKVYKTQKRETLAVELLEKHMESASDVDKINCKLLNKFLRSAPLMQVIEIFGKFQDRSRQERGPGGVGQSHG